MKCEDVQTCLECDVDEGYFLHLDDKKCYDEKDFHFGDENSVEFDYISNDFWKNASGVFKKNSRSCYIAYLNWCKGVIRTSRVHCICDQTGP